jgi:RHS repeat-associated protein
LELDETALLISYEEYYPFGTTSYQAGKGTKEVPLKRYRYCGKERDEESGLNYHGARYYIPWLCRWMSTDPIGIKDGLNVYAYVHNNPITMCDATGNNAMPTPAQMQEIKQRELFSNWYKSLPESKRFEFDRELQDRQFKAEQKYNNQLVLASLPDGTGYVAPRHVFASEYQRQVLAYQFKVLENIKGGIGGAIGYGLGGDKGSFLGAAMDGLMSVASATKGFQEYLGTLQKPPARPAAAIIAPKNPPSARSAQSVKSVAPSITITAETSVTIGKRNEEHTPTEINAGFTRLTVVRFELGVAPAGSPKDKFTFALFFNKSQEVLGSNGSTGGRPLGIRNEERLFLKEFNKALGLNGPSATVMGHAEADAIMDAFRRGLIDGPSGTLVVDRVLCNFCRQSLRNIMPAVGLTELTIYSRAQNGGIIKTVFSAPVPKK